MSRKYWRVFFAPNGADLHNTEIDAQVHSVTAAAPESLQWEVHDESVVRSAFTEEHEFGEEPPKVEMFSYTAAQHRAVTQARKLCREFPMFKNRVRAQFIDECDTQPGDTLTAETDFFNMDRALDV
jgi:hypothetical protein